jgi:RAB protein geranylgeranyltransferase component A
VEQRFDLLIAKLEDIISKFLLKSRLTLYRNLMRSYSSTNVHKNHKISQVSNERQQGIDQANMTAFFDRMIDKYLLFQNAR